MFIQGLGTRLCVIRAGFVALTPLFLSLAGCAQMDPDLVMAGRNDYNIIVQQTEDEQAIQRAPLNSVVNCIEKAAT
jgi:hypothetical protein